MKTPNFCHSRESGNPWPELSEKVVRAKTQRRQGVALRLSVIARTKTWLKVGGKTMDSRVRGNDKMGWGGMSE